MSEVNDRFRTQLNQVLTAIEMCRRDKLVLPLLVLLYSAMDIMASVCRAKSKPEVQRGDFTDWVDKFLLPESKLPCTSEELYGARCGLVHSLKAESSTSRRGTARPIAYAWGEGDCEALNTRIDDRKITTLVGVQIEDLLNAFGKAVTECFAAARKDSSLGERMREHTAGLFDEYLIPPDKGKNIEKA
ncbi:MAG: hypothetical protein JSU63_06015 [Phycisphaerales bacterium]|nr:MAG: hypothetical protein JSU63_06015 [Phycisphaerales bacterium]